MRIGCLLNSLATCSSIIVGRLVSVMGWRDGGWVKGLSACDPFTELICSVNCTCCAYSWLVFTSFNLTWLSHLLPSRSLSPLSHSPTRSFYCPSIYWTSPNWSDNGWNWLTYSCCSFPKLMSYLSTIPPSPYWPESTSSLSACPSSPGQLHPPSVLFPTYNLNILNSSMLMSWPHSMNFHPLPTSCSLLWVYYISPNSLIMFCCS